MSSASTIAALATGWGHSRLGLIRLSGPHVPELLGALLSPAPTGPWTATQTGFRLTDTLDLPSVVLRYDAPRSFTGEDSADLVVPGNPLIIERVLARLIAHRGGTIREAEPGEFSARAFLNGKLTLEQAEGVAATIAAQTESHLAAAELLLSGQTGRIYREWSEALATLLALVEAGIDFTDQEDVVPISPSALRAGLETLLGAIRVQLGASRGQEQSSHHPRVVLVGPPNAGKSTLFNALLGHRRAVESPLAGTTRDALTEPLVVAADDPTTAGTTILLIDLPGLDPHAGGLIDAQAQARAVDEIARADILLLCDPRGRFDAAIPDCSRPTIRVRTKADLPSALAPAAGSLGIPICALDGWNLGVLRRALADAACSDRNSDAPFLLPRHRRALAAAADRLIAAVAAIDPVARTLAHPETVATELGSALNTLAELTGDISPDDIIGRIFATFCVGK